MINHILLLFKRFIFDNRSDRQKIHILALLNYFKTVKKVEQKIEYQKDKLKLHFEKWDPIDTTYSLNTYIYIRQALLMYQEKRSRRGMGKVGLGGEGCMLCYVSL